MTDFVQGLYDGSQVSGLDREGGKPIAGVVRGLLALNSLLLDNGAEELSPCWVTLAVRPILLPGPASFSHELRC